MNAALNSGNINKEDWAWNLACHGPAGPQACNPLFLSEIIPGQDSAPERAFFVMGAAVGPGGFSIGARPSSGSASDDNVSLYKAPQKGMTQKILNEGFQKEDFPGDPTDLYANPDGKAYFGVGDRGREIVNEKYASYGTYDGTVIRVDIPRSDFDQKSGPARSLDAEPGVEVGIPNIMFVELNQYPISLMGGGPEGDAGE